MPLPAHRHNLRSPELQPLHIAIIRSLLNPDLHPILLISPQLPLIPRRPVLLLQPQLNNPALHSGPSQKARPQKARQTQNSNRRETFFSILRRPLQRNLSRPFKPNSRPKRFSLFLFFTSFTRHNMHLSA